MSFRIKKTNDDEKAKPQPPEKFYTKQEIELRYENAQPVPCKKRLISESDQLKSQNIIYDKTTKMWKFSS
jgi:hypothetical protein